MEGVKEGDANAMLRGQAEIWRYMLGFVDSMALKCAVELRIADIIHSHGGHPITLAQIAQSIDGSPSPDLSYLSRIMRLLVRRHIFSVHRPSDGGDSLYGLTNSSRWLIRGCELNLAPMIIMENHPLQLAPWHCLGQCVREGGIAFQKAHGVEMWDFAGDNPEFNIMFNDAMACTAKIITKAVLEAYGDGFGLVGSVVDVGGGTGGVIAEIVRAYPHIQGINFDLPHVVATAPAHDGVEHVGGSMFEVIPMADAVFLKWVLHDWGDEECVKILKNCRKAIASPDRKPIGKVIIIDLVLLDQDGDSPFEDIGVTFDLLMMAHQSGGKERTEAEWKELLEQGGFPRYNIIKIQALPSIIEAFPL
ncbi:(R,S)-reticuline 7-O-methyltransferase-like [Rhodamnia argentea]|uniref:(R,S)-reticuline 7-O-methyltransferase-like n=1 Tax=Rhodamnia argentea TaxID=178133 RepID=A0A8B8QI83_9MYRT|nr:(R,S)-reticuline 7-O-methyltransferase-like [Rhodamnia argentea]